MNTTLRSTTTALLILVLSVAAFAQGQTGVSTSTPIITATASSERVRYVSMGEVQQTRVQVFSADGIQVFDSGFHAGNTIDWQLTDQKESRLPDGSYIFLVTVRDLSGLLTQKFGAAVLEKEQVYLERNGRNELPQAQAIALESNRQAETVSPVDRVGAAGLNRIATPAGITSTTNTLSTGTTTNAQPGQGGENISGTGTTGKLAKWSDGPSGALGDSSIAEDAGGNIGLGKAADSVVRLDISSPYGTIPFRFTQNAPASSSPSLALFATTDGVIGQYAAATTGGTINFLMGATEAKSFGLFANNSYAAPQLVINRNGNVGIGASEPQSKLEVAGSLRVSGAGSGIIFPDGSVMTTANNSGAMSGTSIVSAVNNPATVGVINDNRLSTNLGRLNGSNLWSNPNVFAVGLSANNALITNVGNPVNAGDATNKAYVDASFIKFVPGAEQLSVGDANGTAPMINLRGGSTCCSGPNGHTPAWFKVFQNGSFVATGNLGIGVSPMQGKGYRTSWDAYYGAFRSGYADNEWDGDKIGFFSWAGGSNSTASGLYSLAFGDTNYALSTSSIVFGSGNEVKGAAGFSAGAGNRVCDTYGVALGNNAKSGGPYINGKCDPETFNIRGLAAVAIGYNVTADQDHTTAMGKFASNNGFTGTFIWSDGSAQQSADTFRNTANNEFALRATGGFRFRTNLGGTTGCNLPAGSGVFNCTSSRYTKENFLMVGGEDVLARLRSVPVSTWNYISEGRKVRHIGPVAEDFFQAFGFGTSNTSIGVQDLAGVNLAAVKALDERTIELQKKTLELQQKTAEVEQLRGRVTVLEERLATIERIMQAAGQQSQNK